MSAYSKFDKIVTSTAGNINIGGDSNSPMVWHGGSLKQYSSFYPLNGSMGGVTGVTYRPNNIEGTISGGTALSGDRSFLNTYDPDAFGPWFEAVLSDSSGNLYAYYHAECRVYNDSKIHPRIGCQKSSDGGLTWVDLGGIIIDTPTGTDIADGAPTQLGYGFIGGNGDCSAILDATETYVYFFFSAYGSTAGVQGIFTARMLWSQRDTPVGNVYKYYQGAWTEAGVGGQATRIIQNTGDIHGQFASQNYWWGPAISWNTYLNKYVLCLNRSNNAGFTFTGGQTNYYATCASLLTPEAWAEPQPFEFSSGYLGNWYPMSVGLDAGLGSDKHGGRDVRVFISGDSNWYGKYYRALQNSNPPTRTTARGVGIKP